MQKFFELVVSGAVSGALYSIMAAGLVLTYQTSGIFNFAHGAIAFATAYLYFQLNSPNGQGIHWIPSLILSVVVFAPLLGLLLDRILLQRLAAAPVYARIVGTIGLLIALPSLMLWLIEAVGNDVLGAKLPSISDQAEGGRPAGIGPQPPSKWEPLGIPFDSDKLAVFVAAALAAVLLWYVLRRTRAGLEMRAVVDRDTLAGLRGINAARTSALAWVLSIFLAGLGGVLISPLFALNENVFTLVVLGSLAAVAASGFRSIPIAFAGGLAIGVIQNIFAGYADDFLPDFLTDLPGVRSGAAFPFLLTLLILLIVGRERGRQAGTAADEKPAPDHRAGLSAWRRRLPWIIATTGLLIFTLQVINVDWLQADPYEQGVVATGLAYGLIFLSFVVVTGLGGMVSLAQASFVTAGGFMAGWMLNHDFGINAWGIASDGQVNFLWAALAGAVVAAALGALVAIPLRRLGALPLALASLALAFFLDLVVFNVEEIGQGSFGWSIRPPSLDVPVLNEVVDLLVKGEQDHLDFSQPVQQFLMLLVLFGVVTLLIHSLQRSASGRAMLAVRSSEVAARTSGIAPVKTKIAIFALSAGIAGFGGSMLGLTQFSVTDTTARPIVGLIWIAVAVTFGIRRPGGALIAGLAFGGGFQAILTWVGHEYLPGPLEDLTTSTYFISILFGLGAINLARNPDGLLAMIATDRQEKKLTRQRRADVERAEAEIHGGDVPEHEQIYLGAGSTPAADMRVGAPTMDGAVLGLDRIVAGYDEVEVLHGVSVVVPERHVVAVLGANGAGKSTLCAVAAGLITPTTGRVMLRGTDVSKQPPFRRSREGLLLVPEARGIFPGLSVEENLRVLLRSPEEMTKAYERFPILEERRQQLAGLLSGGEQQMLSLAPALAQPPKVFIADEPTLGLAPLAAEVVVDAIKELRELGSAVLLVEEKAREVMQFADTIVFMELGRVVWSGPRAEADADRLAAAYLGGTTD